MQKTTPERKINETTATTMLVPQPRSRRVWRRLETLLGVGAVHLFGVQDRGLQRMPTGFLAVDEVLQGGLPRGRIAEVYGPAGAGKTRFALHVAKAVIRSGGVAAVVDADCGIERGTLERMGIDPERLVIARPQNGEEAFEVVDQLLSSSAADLIVVDSVAALVPRAELDRGSETRSEAPTAHHARLMSHALRRLTAKAARAQAVVMLINQLRRTWGEDGVGSDVTTGGNALPYAAATRLSLTRCGRQTRVSLTKARFGHEGASALYESAG
jgi:recombination protein RecA